MGDLEAEISSTGDTSDHYCGQAINTMLKGERRGIRIITQHWVGGARGGALLRGGGNSSLQLGLIGHNGNNKQIRDTCNLGAQSHAGH